MNKQIQHDDLPELADAWLLLQRYAPLRPLDNEQEFERTCALGDKLAEVVGDDHAHPLYSLFQLVTHLIEQWEDKHVRLPDAPPREVLRCLLEANDLKPNELVDIASETVLSEILSGRSDIGEDLAKRLAERFRVDVSAFL
jgi:HTH-type transcriptional regulator/antitoxin HigA